MPSQFNGYDQAFQIELPNDLSKITSMSVSGNTLTLVATLSTHRSYAASPTQLMIASAVQGNLYIGVNQQLVDAYGTNV